MNVSASWGKGIGGACTGGGTIGYGPWKAAGKGDKGDGQGIREKLQALETAGFLPLPKLASPNGIVYIRNLPPDCTHFELYKLFAPFGSLASVHAMWHDDWSCKGFGFANFLDDKCADLAIQTLNGQLGFEVTRKKGQGCE